MPETFMLDATHGRILQWLQHYPFQRLDDLVVALSTWNSRTSIYTHLKTLERGRFVEVLTGPLGAGHALYYLSPLGLAWYLLKTETSPLHEAALREARARERTRLVQLMPRIPALLTLQTATNGLIQGAANALTQQGKRAHLIQWSWQRDVTHAFTAQGRAMRWFADGVAAFCMQYAPPDGNIQEFWYRCFLLSTPLTHLRLMRARLDRLLRWREARERWLTYTQMPPILVLAVSERQAEWWREAAERVIHQLGVMPPLGAIASLSSPTSGGLTRSLAENSLWQHPWKRLGSQQVAHLSDLFVPQHDPGFPDLFPQNPRAVLVQGKEPVVPVSARLYQLGHIGPSPPPKRQRQRTYLDIWRRASLAITPRTFELLMLLQAHPLLDRNSLGVHLHLERSSLSHLLVPLVRACLIDRYETSMGERFALSADGLRVLSAASHYHVRYLAHRSGAAGAARPRERTLIPRGLPGLLTQVEHIAGVYGFFEALAALGCLHWWETGTLCTRFYQYQGNWRGIRPDAVAECQGESLTERSPWRFFMEWDRGTMHERDLRRKIGAYAHYMAAREWSREHSTPPALLCVLPDATQEQVLTRIALAYLSDCPVRVTLYTTTRGLLITPGVAAPIWRQVVPPMRRTATDPVLIRLFYPFAVGLGCDHESTSGLSRDR